MNFPWCPVHQLLSNIVGLMFVDPTFTMTSGTPVVMYYRNILVHAVMRPVSNELLRLYLSDFFTVNVCVRCHLEADEPTIKYCVTMIFRRSL